MIDPDRDSIKDLLEKSALVSPSAIWLTLPESGQKYSWSETLSKATEIACYLAGSGIKAGASVAIASPNGAAASFAFLGAVIGGFRATPLNLISGTKNLAFVLSHSKSELILCADENLPIIREALDTTHTKSSTRPIIVVMDNEGPRWRENSIKPVGIKQVARPSSETTALLMYTSGTTGVPKGVLLSHRNLLAAGLNVAEAHELKPHDIGMCILPIYHINGLCVTVMGTLLSKSGLVMPRRFSTSVFWDQMKEFKCSWFSAVPTQFAYLLNDSVKPTLDQTRLRFARSASAPMPPETHLQFEERFNLPIIETMGLTETGAQILSNPLPPKKRKIGSPGIGFGNEIGIVDQDLNFLRPNVEGEIVVRGPNVMLGYLDRPLETRKTISAEGWLRTGDLGRIDEDGYVFVTGRIKELIIKGGENIAPREIDEALLEHNAVLEAAAFPIECANYGQRVGACVRLKESKKATEEELLHFCRERIGDFKSPDSIYFLDDLPKGPSGKIQRQKLIELIL